MRTYIMRDEGGETRIMAKDDAAATRKAERILRECGATYDRSTALHANVGRLGAPSWEQAHVEVVIHPAEPECEDGAEHDWQSPLSLVGGIAENPGVWGSGHGGVSITEACVRCGCKRTKDTGGTDPYDGTQMETVEYEVGAYDVSEVRS